MNQSMLTATNTLRQLQDKIDTISHNVANVDTNGYKSKQASFTDLLVPANQQPAGYIQRNRQKNAVRHPDRHGGKTGTSGHFPIAGGT